MMQQFDYPSSVDFHTLSLLWQEAFGQTQEDAAFFLKNRIRPGELIILRDDNGVPSSMMTLIPARLGDVVGTYLYAAATFRKYQGQGMMKRLHEEAIAYLRSQGSRFICAAPSTIEGFSALSRLGYQVRFYRSQRSYTSLTPCPFIELHSPSTVDFIAQRSVFLGRRPYRLRLMCPEYLIADLRHYGGDVVCFETEDMKGYAAYTIEGKTLHIRECSVRYSPELGASLLAYTGCKNILLDLEGKKIPVGMYRPIGIDPFHGEFTGHISLCLDAPLTGRFC